MSRGADTMATESTAATEAMAEEVHYLDKAERPAALRISDALISFVDFVGRLASWLFVNLGRIFGSTLLQELEWHFHTALFALVLGYGYIWNTHVRVDLVRENLAFRNKAWLELFGLTFFMIPYCLIVIWFAWIYAYDSFMIHEISASQVGLAHRWIIKSVLVLGLIIAALSGVAVWLQVAIVLWGPQNVRFPLMTLEWPEESGTRIEGKVRIALEALEEGVWDREPEIFQPAPNPAPAASTGD